MSMIGGPGFAAIWAGPISNAATSIHAFMSVSPAVGAAFSFPLHIRWISEDGEILSCSNAVRNRTGRYVPGAAICFFASRRFRSWWPLPDAELLA